MKPSHNKLMTCRYWAFGPSCPNIDTDGVECCEYAHWDTGHLSNYHDQRGTCYFWAHEGICQYGSACKFEHRETGVMGPHHGKLQLDGLNLQIAEAAVKSGFDTLNHTALLDLIWAVRRVAFGHGAAKPSNQRPPKHPDYPDRFRPCESQKDSYQKREKPSQKRRRAPETQNVNKGTASDPVDLDEDIDSLKKEQNSPPWHKRRKISYGDLCYKPAPAPGDLAAIKHSVFPNSRIRAPSYRLKQPRKWQGGSTQRSSISTAAPRPHLPTLQSSLSPPPFIAGSYQAFAFGRRIEKTTIQEQQALPDLRHVKKSLRQNADAVVDCLGIMKDLFDTNSELRKDGVMDALIKLKDDMMTCLAGAAAAMEDVDGIVDFVHCGKKLQ